MRAVDVGGATGQNGAGVAPAFRGPARNNVERYSRLEVLRRDDKYTSARVPYARLGEVLALLEANSVGHFFDEDIRSFDNGPEVVSITLDPETDGRKVQHLLDTLA